MINNTLRINSSLIGHPIKVQLDSQKEKVQLNKNMGLCRFAFLPRTSIVSKISLIALCGLILVSLNSAVAKRVYFLLFFPFLQGCRDSLDMMPKEKR